MSFWWKFLRMNQWAKNLLLFIPAFFAGIAFQDQIWVNTSFAFIGFSLLSSGIYVINDFKDKELDVLHPHKKKRLITSEKFSRKQVVLIACLLFIFGLLIIGSISTSLLLLGLAYVINGFLYNYYFKKLALIDLLSLLVGYIIRLYIGAIIASIPISFWLFAMVLLLAVIFILIKRNSDVLVYQQSGKELRPTVIHYANFNLIHTIHLLLWCSCAVYACYLGLVYFLFQGQNLLLALTLVFFAGFIIVLMQSIRKNPHEDPLKMILFQPMNLLGMVVSFIVFYLVIHGK